MLNHIKIENTNLFIIYMQEQQNLSQKLVEIQNIRQINTDSKGGSSFSLKNQKSPPKFARKNEFRVTDKKQISSSNPNQQLFVYMSPTKSFTTQERIKGLLLINSPSFQQLKKSFISNAGSVKASGEFNTNTINNDQLAKIIQEKDNQIKLLNLDIGKLQKIVIKKNKEITGKREQLQNMQSFLLEREGFISQLIEKNIILNQLLSKYQSQKLEQQQLYSSFQQKYLNEKNQWQSNLKNQDQQIQKIKKINLNLEKDFSQISSTLKSLKKKSRSKQNNENLNKEHQKKPTKSSLSRSCICQQSPHQGKRKSKIHSNEFNVSHLTVKGDIESFQSFPGDSKLHQNRQQALSIKNYKEKLINNLQQKVKYSQIQISVLQKVKYDQMKTRQDNDKLKAQNRKLLYRIDYLNRNLSRKNIEDSSLQLSLSPVKK